jgi:hypothetical protein
MSRILIRANGPKHSGNIFERFLPDLAEVYTVLSGAKSIF